jgi:diguanylate cyclase
LAWSLRLRGTFIRSRLARRVFWALLLAALLPLGLFGQLVQRQQQAQQASAVREAEAARVREAGMRLFDRLQAAQNLLAASDGSLLPAMEPATAPTSQPLLRGIGESPPGPWPAPGSVQALRWETASAPAPGRIWLTVVLPHGGLREAEVHPDYLWADMGDDGSLAGVCVLAAPGQALFCPDGEAAATGQRWALFLGGGFGAPDWTLAAVPARGLPVGATPLQAAMTPALLASMLLAAFLGLLLVRRLLGPIEDLGRATRALAQGRWAVRVPVQGHDELGALAQAFNTMAHRVQRQVEAMDVQADVDRAILGRVDLDAALGRVAQRLSRLSRDGYAVVLARAPEGDAWQAWLAGPGGLAAVEGLPATLDQGLPSTVGRWSGAPGAAPSWWTQLLAATGTPPGSTLTTGLQWDVASSSAQRVGLLALAGGPAAEDPDLALRELADLRDRVAVTLSAAAHQHRLVERAQRDPLTGLLNRSGLQEASERVLAAGQATLVFVDLDFFKEVNDTLGHELGDLLLCAVAGRLKGLLPPNATLARQGGDEFVLLLPGAAPQAEAVAEAVCRALAQPFALGTAGGSAAQAAQAVQVGASLGLASAPGDGRDLMTLMRRADMALYAAKTAGRGRWEHFTPALDAAAAERAWLQRELRQAVAQAQLLLHYQPRLDARSGAVASVEALLRWPHPQRGWIAPDRFIPVAEDSGLIDTMGWWVLQTGLAQMQRWRQQALPVGRMAVNVSARQLRVDNFADRVLAAVQAAGLSPADLELELTESLFAGDTARVCSQLAPLRAAGVHIALDDFGTGYSSLAALQRLPVDTLKIDRSFVVDLGQRDSAEAVARTVVALGRALGKRVTAEGVETAAQVQRLVALGCDELQGWRYARAEPAEACAARIRKGFAPPAADVDAAGEGPAAATAPQATTLAG